MIFDKFNFTSGRELFSGGDDDDCPSQAGSGSTPHPSSTKPSSTNASSTHSTATSSDTSTMSSSSTTSFTLSHDPTQDPALAAPAPVHKTFDTATLIALILGLSMYR